MNKVQSKGLKALQAGFLGLLSYISFFGADASSEVVTAMDTVLSAVRLEEQAPRKQATITYWIGTREILYKIDRVLPDRVRVRAESGGYAKDVIGIGTTVYIFDQGVWRKTSAAPLPMPPMSVADLFRQRLEKLTEGDKFLDRDGRLLRVFSGSISWSSGTAMLVKNRGELTVFVDTFNGLLRGMSFKGRCGEQTCRFEHAIQYNQSVDIVAPN